MPKSTSVTSYVARRRWTATEARAVLSAAQTSGLSVGAFAEREGLDVNRLYRWRQRLGALRPVGKRPNRTPVPAFIELQRPADGRVEIVLRSGRVLRVSESIDVAALHRLIGALESPC